MTSEVTLKQQPKDKATEIQTSRETSSIWQRPEQHGHESAEHGMHNEQTRSGEHLDWL